VKTHKQKPVPRPFATVRGGVGQEEREKRLRLYKESPGSKVGRPAYIDGRPLGSIIQKKSEPLTWNQTDPPACNSGAARCMQ